MLLLGAAFSRSQTGWLRQSPWLAERLRPVPGIVNQDDIDRIAADWDTACEQVHRHALARAKEIERVARVHRDPFEPIRRHARRLQPSVSGGVIFSLFMSWLRGKA